MAARKIHVVVGVNKSALREMIRGGSERGQIVYRSLSRFP